MKFFYSPLKLIGLIKEKDTIDSKLKENPADWYFSKDGENAFNNAKTPAQKTMHFFHYLLTVAKSKDNKAALYKVAYIMANSMVNSSLEFAGYPNVLDSTKNPLVNHVKTAGFSSDNQTANGILLLAALHHEVDSQKYIHAKNKPYLFLTYCEADGAVSDAYKIERDIIGAFCTDFSDHYLMPPYMYAIIDSSKQNTNEEVDNEE